MNSLKSKVAYLNGLIDGLGIQDDSKEGKVILEMSKILGDMAEKLEALEDVQNDMEEYLDAINEDLKDVEDDFYGDEDDCENDYAQYEDIDDDFIDILCPHCNETVYLDKNMYDNHYGIKCPNCHTDMVLECNDCNGESND
jgi:DNA-directed RNA polymerase subunit delta